MEFKQLEAFVHVVKLNSFSKAADMIFLSQPTISSHISALEKELGVQLLIRSTKAVHPTKTGMEFYRYAQNILALRDQSVHSISTLGKDTKGEIDILASTVPSQYLLPEIISGFQRRYPEIVVRVHQASSSEVVDGLDGCDHDFGILGAKIGGKKFRCTPFYTDTSIIILPANLPMDDVEFKAQIRSSLLTMPFVMREEGSATRKELQVFLRNLGLSLEDLNTVGYFNDTQSVVHAVANGMGISFVSKIASSMYAEMGLVKQVEIDEPAFVRQFCILQREDMILSPMVALLTEYIHTYYDSQL